MLQKSSQYNVGKLSPILTLVFLFHRTCSSLLLTFELLQGVHGKTPQSRECVRKEDENSVYG